MENNNDFNVNKEKKENPPLEVPENSPSSQPKPIKNTKAARKMKAAYAFALLIALGAAFTAKIASEKALGQLQVPIESDYVTTTKENPVTSPFFATTEPDYEVRQNLTDVPDTREETEEQTNTSEKSLYATPYKDYYVLPMGTKIHKEYSPQNPVYNPTLGDWRTHNGIDFKGVEGDQVKAIAYGEVLSVYDDVVWGTVVEINHGNSVIAKYCGLNKDTVDLKAGATVKGGDLVGYLGVVPGEKTDVSHLHFEVFYNGKNVDPLELMGK